jgi:hypothetical protein
LGDGLDSPSLLRVCLPAGLRVRLRGRGRGRGCLEVSSKSRDSPCIQQCLGQGRVRARFAFRNVRVLKIAHLSPRLRLCLSLLEAFPIGIQ